MKWIPAQLQNGMDDHFVQNLICIFHRKSAEKTCLNTYNQMKIQF